MTYWGVPPRKDINEPKAIKGSKYYNDNFFPAIIDSTDSKPVLVRYNAVDDEIEFERDGQILYLNYNKHNELTFVGTDKKYIYTTFNDGSSVVSGYLISLKENKNVSLFKREQKIFIDKKIAKDSYEPTVSAKYKALNDVYYAKILNENAEILPTNKKKLSKLFPGKEKQILKYIKFNKISLKKEADLIKLVNYIDSLY